MGILNSIFGKKEEKKQEVTNNKGIRYKDDLIGMLIEDHQGLFSLYGGILEDIKKEDFDGILDKLNEFKTEIGMHVYIENIQLYTYIKTYFEDQSEQLGFIEQVQKDMDKIVKTVVDFVEFWTNNGINKENIESFQEELEGIGSALTKRTKMEETRLYTLYQK